MKGILHFLARLYPRSWRERYGVEFDALLEDASPRWRDLPDVLWGALVMQMREWGFGKIVAALALTGALLGLAGSFALPEQYVSEAVLRVVYADRTDALLSLVMSHVFRKEQLEEFVRREGLYDRELSQKPMYDVLQDMRQAIRVSYSGADTIDIAFNYEDRNKAQRTLRDIVDLMTLQLPGLQVMKRASLPESPVEPNRALIAWYGVGTGVLMAFALTLFRRPTNRIQASLRLASALGLIGAIVGWGVSFAIPQKYVSTGLVKIRTVKGIATDREINEYLDNITPKVLDPLSLKVLIEQTQVYGQGEPTDESIQKLRRDIRMTRVSAGEFGISIECGDPVKAQRVTAGLVGSVMFENTRGRHPFNLEVHNPASLPEVPVSPKRPLVAGYGMGAALLIALAFSRRLHPVFA